MRTQLVLGSLLVLLSACSGGSDSPTPAVPPVNAPAGAISAATAAQIDAYISTAMSQQHVAGLALVVTMDGKPVLEKGYGLADVAANRAVNADTVFQIGSITKQFTASAIMMLVQDGRVKLDDPVGRYLPTAPEAWRGITLRHLLTHTSGLARDFPDEMLASLDGNSLPPIDTLVALSKQVPVNNAPGQVFEYSNVGYHLLGFVVEKVSGQHFAQFLRQRVFTPLGMGTADLISAPAQTGVATGYDWSGIRFAPASRLAMTPGYMEGEGGLRMSARDLAKWDAALLTEQFVTKASLAQMHTPAVLADGSTVPYGFGWGLNDVNGHPYTAHNGGLPGFRAQFERHTGDGLAVIVLTNASEGHPEIIAARVTALVKPELDWITVPDPRPQVGTLVRSVMDDAMAGKLVVDQRFAPGMAAILSPEMISGLQATLVTLGPIEHFGYIDETPAADGRVMRYLVRTRFSQLLLHVQVDSDGRLSSFRVAAG
ncbi:MAG: serine hydrolase domain-containing protein [Gammaproteobacteria bacterium]